MGGGGCPSQCQLCEDLERDTVEHCRKNTKDLASQGVGAWWVPSRVAISCAWKVSLQLCPMPHSEKSYHDGEEAGKGR